MSFQTCVTVTQMGGKKGIATVQFYSEKGIVPFKDVKPLFLHLT